MINKKLYTFSGETHKYICITTFLSTLKLIASISFSFLFAFLLNKIMKKEFELNYFFIALVFIGIVFLRQISTMKVAKMLGILAVDAKKNLRNAIFNKALKLGVTYSQYFKTQELIHLSIDNVEHLEIFFGGFLTQFYYCVVSSIILFLTIFPFNMKAAFILLGFALFIPLFLYISLNQVKKVQKKYFAKYMNVGTLFLDSLQGLTTLKLYGTDEAREKEIDKMSEEFRVETMRVLKMQLLSIAVVNWIIFGGTIWGIIHAINSFANGTLSLAHLLFIFMITPEFFIPMRTLTALFHVAMTGVAAADNIMKFLDAPEKKASGEENFPNNSTVKIENLNFSYPDGTIALKNINMDFKENSLTAIVGYSGCGKSTLVSILAGELNYNLDNIKIGDEKVSKIKIDEFSKNIIKITHDSHIFAGSVRENLNMGNINISDESMIETLKKLKLWEIFKNQQGLDTKLESQGKNLSGGQAQRISLGRALLYDAKIYIFDEATSNIDIESEEIILNTIYDIAKEKIIIYISHRLPAIKNADIIYVMDEGSVAQSGKHFELYSQDGLYKNMYLHQEQLESYLVKKGGQDEQ